MKKRSLSILFIGNSFSYYHALPKLLALFAEETGSADVFVDGAFRGGATLKMLWEEGTALKKIRARKWDYVVLQERGRLGGLIKDGVVHAGKPGIFFSYATKFDKEIKKAGGKTVLYCPPAFLGIKAFDDAKKMESAYVTLARKLHVTSISSIGAFMLAGKRKPTLNLYESDEVHPNSFGVYLLASIFYRKLFHKKVADLPLKSYSSRSQELPKNPIVVKVSKADAKFLWSVANQGK